MIFDPEKSLPDYADRLEAVVLYEAYLKAENTYQAFQDAANAGDLSIAAQDALETYEVHGVDLLIDVLSNQVIRCALTGVPLLATTEDSEWVLAAAIKPPRSTERAAVEMAEAYSGPRTITEWRIRSGPKEDVGEKVAEEVT